MRKVLTIAGSDSSGGAGIQADIKTITVHGMYAMSAITALTAQNTTGVYGVMEVDSTFVEQQLDCIFQDIRPDAVKIGMVSNGSIMKSIANKLVEYEAKRVVVDPVMVATSGGRLMQKEAVGRFLDTLFTIADIITPNLSEAQVLSGMEIRDKKDMEMAAKKISRMIDRYEKEKLNLPQENKRPCILIKGGHWKDNADDLLYLSGEEEMIWIPGTRIENPNTHGTGCTLSSAIACHLADGYSMKESVQRAKKYLSGAIQDGLNMGHGNGPLNHMYQMV